MPTNVTTTQPARIVLSSDMVWPFFLNWMTTHPGETLNQLISGFEKFYIVSAEDIKALRQRFKATPPNPTPIPTPKPTPTVNPGLTIQTTPYPKWWKDAYVWNISINDAGVWPIIPNTPGYRTYISTIVINVSGETDITFTFGPFPTTGIMNFGGDSEPRGMVIAMGESPTPCGERGFTISSNGAGILVSGFVVYYYEKITP